MPILPGTPPKESSRGVTIEGTDLSKLITTDSTTTQPELATQQEQDVLHARNPLSLRMKEISTLELSTVAAVQKQFGEVINELKKREAQIIFEVTSVCQKSITTLEQHQQLNAENHDLQIANTPQDSYLSYNTVPSVESGDIRCSFNSTLLCIFAVMRTNMS